MLQKKQKKKQIFFMGNLMCRHLSEKTLCIKLHHYKTRSITTTITIFLIYITLGKCLSIVHCHCECDVKTRLGQLGANISPDRSSLTPQVLIGNFLKHNYPLLYELQHINLLCLYLPKEDGVSPDAEYTTQIIFSIFLQ